MRIWIALFPALLIGCSPPLDESVAVNDTAGEDREVLKPFSTGDEFSEHENDSPSKGRNPNDERLKAIDSHEDSIPDQVIGPEAVPHAWLEEQSETIKAKIHDLDLRLSIVDGEFRVGVVAENGEWITWPGSRSFSGGSTGYLFHNPNPGVPIRY